MKLFLIAFAFLAATQAASLKRKSFQEHYLDFNMLIVEEVGEQIFELMERYEDELEAVYEYFTNQDFAQLIAEMETIPEFNALIDFLEEDGIEIHFYIALMHEVLGLEPYEYLRHNRKSGAIVRQSSDNALARYLDELMNLMPIDKLRSLYEEKIATDEEFRVTMENLQSQEFADLWNALLANEVFQSEVARLREHDIHIEVVINLLLASLGLLNA